MGEEGEQQTTRCDDERPNSGLREGEISHTEVNTALRAHHKTVILA